MQITALDHLVLTTSNFERCVWFYRDVLGDGTVVPGRPLCISLRYAEDQCSSLSCGIFAAAGNVAYGSLDICLLTVTELPIVYQELAKHGIAVEVGIVERNGA